MPRAGIKGQKYGFQISFCTWILSHATSYLQKLVMHGSNVPLSSPCRHEIPELNSLPLVTVMFMLQQITIFSFRQDREKFVLASKVRGSMDPDNPNSQGLSRAHIMRSIDKSLSRLQTNYLDLYQVRVTYFVLNSTKFPA